MLERCWKCAWIDSAVPRKSQKISGSTTLRASKDPNERNCDDHRQGGYPVAQATRKRGKLFYACTNLQASASRRLETEITNAHLAERGFNALSHDNFAARTFSCTPSNDNCRRRSRSRQRLGKIKNLPAWQEKKVKEQNRSLFATLMDVCNLKNSELVFEGKLMTKSHSQEPAIVVALKRAVARQLEGIEIALEESQVGAHAANGQHCRSNPACGLTDQHASKMQMSSS